MSASGGGRLPKIIETPGEPAGDKQPPVRPPRREVVRPAVAGGAHAPASLVLRRQSVGGCSGWVRHAPDEGRGAGDKSRLCEAVRPEGIDNPLQDLASARRAWRLVEEEEPPIVSECPAEACQLFRRRSRPENVDVDGEGLVEAGRARVEVRQGEGCEREQP